MMLVRRDSKRFSDMKASSSFRLLCVVGLICLTACASQFHVLKIDVTSDPPGASVDVNGVHAGITPFKTDVTVTRQWVGVANSPTGYGYPKQNFEFVAYPPNGATGSFQKKVISPEQLEAGGRLHFKFGQVTNVAPQEIDLQIRNKR